MQSLKQDYDNGKIRTLREEGDDLLPHEPLRQRLFLSTPSARRATCAVRYSAAAVEISIHVLREEGDA